MEELKVLHSRISAFIQENWRNSLKEPTGGLKYKFLDPAANYRGQLWDWDSYFCGLALLDVYDDISEYIKGCVLNFIDYAALDGSIPYMINAGKKTVFSYAEPGIPKVGRSRESDINSIKPLLAQMTLLACRKNREYSWIKSIYCNLRKHIEHWENTQRVGNGLFVWRSYRGSGTDNHPAVYGRPLNSSAGVELNCFMYREYLAMSEIAAICQDEDSAHQYRHAAHCLAEAINAHMWDEIDGLYYHLDVGSHKPLLAVQDVTWDVPMKFRAWTCFLPMWAGITDAERAERMVKEHLLNRKEFWSEYGIRTLAKNEKMFSTKEMSNPSNWQGPVWIVSTYLVFAGLLQYGYIREAMDLTRNLLRNLVRDIDFCGVLHEYYHPENGKSSIAPGFLNWNALAGIMVPQIIEALERTESDERSKFETG